MFSSQLLTRAGIAVSVTGHVLFLVWVIFFAGSHPFEPKPVEAIAVDIVTPDEVPQPAKQEPTPPQETPKPPDTLTLPDMSDKTMPDTAKPAEEKTKPADPPPQEAAAPPPAAPPPPPAPAPAPAPQATPAQPPPPQAADTPPPPQPAPPSPQAAPPQAEPDITEKFGMMFTLPDARGAGNFDAQATDAADVSSKAIAALRSHLKTCTPLPKSITAADDIQIVLRVAFMPDGNLATEPMLIKGPRPTPKVLAMLQGAISGLQACQPYSMLPADKYNEWKSLDLSFTPRDFGGG